MRLPTGLPLRTPQSYGHRNRPADGQQRQMCACRQFGLLLQPEYAKSKRDDAGNHVLN
jgi:hypothetical protein